MSTSILPTIRVLVVGGHTLMRAGLCMLLESQPVLSIVGEVGTCVDAVTMATREQPDVIVLDLLLGSENTLDCLAELRAVASGARTLILTGVYDSQLHRQAVLLGAVGLVLKNQAPEILFKAIERVHAGEVWIERAMMAHVLDHMTRSSGDADPAAAGIARLTGREREVLGLIGHGLRNKQIAERLCISEVTVRHHLTSVYDKLGVADRLELVIYAYQHGLARSSP